VEIGIVSVTIKLFASLREALGEYEFQLELDTLPVADVTDGMANVAAIKSALSARGAQWQEALNQPNLVHALNHKVVYVDAMVADGDELALFPPMTGG
jgi:molybdopterin synthase sulfur carrier subunit